MSNLHYQQITRGMRRALAHGGESLVWKSQAGDVPFLAIKSDPRMIAGQPAHDGVQLNAGENTPCVLDCLAEDFPGGALPGQEDTVEAADGSLNYRIERREWIPGHPIVRLHCPNVVNASI